MTKHGLTKSYKGLFFGKCVGTLFEGRPVHSMHVLSPSEEFLQFNNTTYFRDHLFEVEVSERLGRTHSKEQLAFFFRLVTSETS